MKNKSSHHKSTNRFKFTPFAERINAIDIRRSALYRLEHANIDAPAEEETFFHNTLVRWKALNLTDEYIKFTKDFECVFTLPQLLHKKDEIITCILQQLENAAILNLQPFLELVVALARDLREDFYQHFESFLSSIMKLLNTKDAEQIEYTFICLAFLFKYLRVYLKRDISIVLKLVLPLFSESSKWYIRNFGAESFAFVARDVKDKKRFLEVLIKSSQNDEQVINGCGHLLFEVIRGVSGQFHSCASSFLSLFFSSMQEEKESDKKMLFRILTQTTGDMLETIHTHNSKIFWDSIINGIQSFFYITTVNKKPCWKLKNLESVSLEYTLKLLGQCLEYNGGKFLTDALPILDLINNMVNAKLSEECTQIISKIGVLVLLCSHISLPHESSVYFVRKLLSIPYLNVVSSFVQEIVPYYNFDVIIFPHFIESIICCDSDLMKVLASICLKKSPLCKSGSDMYSWVKYPIDFGKKIEDFSKFLFDLFEIETLSILNSPDNYLCALICLPHIKNLKINELKIILKRMLSNLITNLQYMAKENEIDKIQNTLFFLSIAIESVIHTFSSECINDICELDILIENLSPYICDHKYICSLRILDLILTVKESEHSLTYVTFVKLYPLLEKNLTSPFHEVRVLTTHICSLFEFVLPTSFASRKKRNNCSENDESYNTNSENQKKESFKVFSLCYGAESQSLSVENYREQLLKLSKTVYNSVQYKLGSETFFKHFPLKFMLGFLNVNFKLLWDPLQNLILTFANGLQANEFWDVFYPCLIQVTNSIRSLKEENIKYEYSGNYFDSVFQEYCSISDKPDYLTYRGHLLEILYQAPTLSEIKNRDITMLFLDFIEVEFEKRHISSSLTHNSMDVDLEMDAGNENKNNLEPNMENDDENEKITVKKSTYDTLIFYLKIYSNIQNPKALHKEQILKSIYYDFLMHKNPSIQKVALDCLMKYKNKHWKPYKDQMYNLIDGKKFKEELRVFKVNPESELIKDEDREELMPLLLRIAFSKMITNIGIDKKGGSQMRKSLVMRFISGCKESELIIFLNMAFKVYVDFIDLDLNSMYEKINSSIDFFDSLTPRQMFGSIKLVETMREQLIKPGEVNLLPRLLKIILCIGTFVEKKLTELSGEKSGYLNTLKIIKNDCILSIGNFFKQFDQWMWTEEEILYIYDNFIWTSVEKLPTEGIHSPNALLKLFNTWSQYPRYHILYSVFNQHDKNTILYYILTLMSKKKLNASVYDMCMHIIERFLTLEYDEANVISLSENRIQVFKNNEVIEKLNLKENLNTGSLILMPYVSNIIFVLKDRIRNTPPKKLTRRDITILSRLIEITYEPESVDMLLNFSLPILIQRLSTTDSEDNYETCIDALEKLLNKSNNPMKHIKTIIPLFSKVNTAKARKHLCESLLVLATKCNDESLSVTAKIVLEMNACDEKWIEQPDYEKRLAVYKTIYKMFDENTINLELASLIVHNCFHTITNSNDLSLRSNASSCLKKIVPKLVGNFKNYDFFIQETVLCHIKSGLKSNNDNLKLDSIALLGTLVRECTDVLPIFKELHPLSNKNDMEIDIFENLQHLQIHRKIRALLRFCNYVKMSSNVPSSKTLIHIILPLASQYICNEKIVDKYSLVEAAIETIGCICRLLPWYHYESVLKHYLLKLNHSTEHQKQLIKIISVILDSFHFDLSKADVGELLESAIHKKETKCNTNKETKNDNVLSQNDEEKINFDENINDVDIADEMVIENNIIPFERVQVLSPSVAKRVIYTVTNDILLQLNWSSSQISEHESTHKLLKKGNVKAQESEDKLRIPMSFAVVKLLQKLPQPMLDNNILSILMKVCNYLKSPLINVRTSAREIIAKIMSTIGTKYFDLLLNHLTTLLTRGFQVHVLISTVHTILEALKGLFMPNEMNKFSENIIKVCLNDLFGHASEEKEVVKLGNKAPEAKPSKKSFLTLRIVSQNISDSCIVRLLSPFKNIIENTHSKRIVIKIEGCFQYMSLGLVENPNISIESSLIFLCGLLSDSIPKLSVRTKKNVSKILTLEAPKPKKTDCFLIPPDPKGSKKAPKPVSVCTSSSANAHVIIEFGLNMLYTVLQKEKLGTVDCKPYLDPMVPFILNALDSSYVKVVTLALKCISSLWIKKMNLPSLKKEIERAVNAVFHILHKYATSGISKKDDNFHLVTNCFKAVTSLVRNVSYYTFNTYQMKTLLMYAEHDIYDSEKQATAFSLLKAILSAKFNPPELKDVIEKVIKTSITSESPRVREESSQVILLYLTHYPSQKRMKHHIQFYVSQLDYELEYGRIAALKILILIVENLTEETLAGNAGFMFVSLGMRLVCESNNECQTLIITCIEKLLSSMSTMKRNELFNLTMVMLSDEKPVHQEISAYLMVPFIVVEKDAFKNRIKSILPKISDNLYGENLNVGRFVKVHSNLSNGENDGIQRDNSYIQMLKLLNTIGEKFPQTIFSMQFCSLIDEIGYNCQEFLAHPNIAVRLYASKFLTKILNSFNSEDMYNSMIKNDDSQHRFLHTLESLKSLILDLISQLIPGEISEELASSVFENISTLLNIVSNFPDDLVPTEKLSVDEVYINVVWIAKKVKSAINTEVVKTPSITVVRFAAFKMLDKLITHLKIKNLVKIVYILVPCIVREMKKSDKKFEELVNCVTQISTALSNKLGNELYNEMVAKVQNRIINKKRERKIKISQDKVNNPEKAAKRKLILQEKKKDYKKRKMDKLKGRMPNPKVKRVESMDID